jgi:signal transduction histidine kinase
MTSASNMPGESLRHLAAALTDSLKAIDADYREEMREIRALIEEARKEAQKDEPNGAKLKAILADCNGIVRTFAALDPAWLGVQRVARLIGIL